jgi:UDP-GlcNAc:undecaprenyl-phosphate GlcNAc-1-phosphate transferase
MTEGLLENPFAAGASAFLASLFFTWLVRKVARERGFVAAPKADRWHKKPTAMFGGVAIFLATVAGYFVFVPVTEESLVVFGASSLLFAVGFIDDLLNIKPYQKLIGQLIGASLIVGAGLRLNWTGYDLFDIWLTVFWLVGITNAINLLDNMDGLAAGISAIAAVSLAFSFGAGGQSAELLLASVFIGALVGFLVFNFNPASIFMGDCGSMFIGFLLASSVLLNQMGGRSRGVVTILAVPALILFVPIFDTTFVTILRKFSGRRASQGGRDHTSHRLVALGLSERKAVLMLYAFALLAGSIAVLARELEVTESLALIAAFSVVLIIIGVYLAKVKVYGDDEAAAAGDNAVFGFLLNVSHKRRVFEVMMDAVIVTLAYYSAYVLLFGPLESSGNWDLFIESLPLLVVLKLFAFLVAGVYRGLWRYTGVRDLVTFAKAVAAGGALSALAILLLYRFENYSRGVFVLDAILCFLFIASSRFAFRLFRHVLPGSAVGEGRRVLIYGAGDAGELVLRELRNNPDWDYVPVGFIDDDPLKTGKMIHGLPVFGGEAGIGEVCRANGVQDVLVSFRDIGPQRLRQMRTDCQDANIGLKRAQFTIESVDLD